MNLKARKRSGFEMFFLEEGKNSSNCFVGARNGCVAPGVVEM